MNSFIQANIFFFITSVAVVLVTILVIVLLAYLVLILRDFKGVSRRVKEETDLIAVDINDARAHLRKEGADLKNAFDYFKHLALGKKTQGRGKKK